MYSKFPYRFILIIVKQFVNVLEKLVGYGAIENLNRHFSTKIYKSK